jgi:hypothetical protein
MSQARASKETTAAEGYVRRVSSMKGILVFVLGLTVLLSPMTSAFSENSLYQIVMYKLKEGGVRDIRDDFRQSDKIFADFTFSPQAKESIIEFRWINPLNNKEQSYVEVVNLPATSTKHTLLCWIQMNPSLPEKIIGSRFFGRWRLEMWVNGSRVAEKGFNVGN